MHTRFSASSAAMGPVKGPRSQPALPLGWLATLAFLTWFTTACSDDPAGQPAATNCPAGEAPRFDVQTGAFLGCFASDDGGSLDDAQDAAQQSDQSAATDAALDTAADVADISAGSDSSDATGSDSSATCPPGLTALERWWQCPPERTDGDGLHGEACTSDADCWYGHCLFGSPFAGYDPTIGICTKNCGFGGPGTGFTECVKDNGNNLVFKCTFEKTKQSGNDKIPDDQPNVFKACLRECKTDAECQAWNPNLPNCVLDSDQYLSIGATKVCVKKITQ